MDLNSTSAPQANISEGWLRDCPASVEKYDPVGYTLAVFNSLCVILNIVHIFILSRISALKGTPYYYVLIHISLGDILLAFFLMLRLTLDKKTYFENSSMETVLLYTILSGSTTYYRLFTIAASSVERYLAVCKPLKYPTYHFISKLNIWLTISWFVAVLACMIRDLLSLDALCFIPVLGPITTIGKSTGLVNICIEFFSFFLSTAILIRVFIELRRVDQQQSGTEGRINKKVRKATHYLMVAVGLFYVCNLLPYVPYLLYVIGVSRGTTAVVLHYASYPFLMPAYGYVNVIIYGWMSSAYRKQLKKLLGCKVDKQEQTATSEF